jgi:recombination associated protein RdgC
MWFKNLQIYRLPAPFNIDLEQLQQQLSRQAFASCSASDMQTQGWTSPIGNEFLYHHVNQQILLQLTTEKKLLPSSVINQVTKAKAADLAEQQGYAPGRKQMKDLKERVTEELLPRAFGIQRATRVSLDTKHGWLLIDSSSPSKADEVLKILLKCVDKLPLESLRVKTSPQAAMTDWLASDAAPKGFTIDQDTELKAHTEDKATIRYVHHSLDAEDVQRHIAAGKQCTKLALTWNDRISFVLTDSLAVKRIKPLDILDDEKSTTGSTKEEQFDADFVLMSSELAQMLDDLVYALGGEMPAAQAA